MRLPPLYGYAVILKTLSIFALMFTVIGCFNPLYAADKPSAASVYAPVLVKSEISYENATISEDVTWHGTVLIRGYLVVAPQATLRIEPGTVVRFMKSAITRQLPRLVVMGRIHCNGIAENPIIFTPNVTDVAKGDWGGILLLSSEKKNLFEQCRIEGAKTGLESVFSTFVVNGMAIVKTTTGMLLRDSTANLSLMAIDGCETGFEVYDSEAELRDGSLTGNRSGIVAHRSGIVLASMVIKKSALNGVTAEECRIKISDSELAENSIGAVIIKGEGNVLLSRFVRNREAGLQLSSARVRVQRSLFGDNSRDGIRIDGGRSTIWWSSFSGNGGYNIANSGPQNVTAVLNWWGSADETAIMAKLIDPAKKVGFGSVLFSPWLPAKPESTP